MKNSRPVYYMQTDSKWAGLDYSAKGEHTTIGRAGCGPTCAAMVIATWKDKNITPPKTASWALKHGYKAAGQGTYYSYFTPQGKVYGIDVKMLNSVNLRTMDKTKRKEYDQKARAAVKTGNLVIACMGPGLWTHGGHYILWYGMDEEHVLINDPASKSPERLKAPWKTFRDQVKYYFLCKK
ncbi:C39 family peptidase [Anaerovorax odorimutans]|nr:C39 family peptidase [Anaerovorax odorimutans]